MNLPAASQSLSRKSGRSRACGFSLLEIIVAMSLGMVLLSAVWTMFNLLGRRQASELRQSDRNQLIRSLHQRLTRDLKNLIALDDTMDQPLPDYVPDVAMIRLGANGFQVPLHVPSAILSPEPMEVLTGSSTSLALEVFVEPLAMNEPKINSDLGRLDKLNEIFEGPVTKQVRYEMGLADDSAAFEKIQKTSPPKPAASRRNVDQVIGQGFVRRESIIDVQEKNGSENERVVRKSWPNHFSNFLGSNNSQTIEPTSAVSRVTLVDDMVPDVVAVRFAYFDGRSWLTHWNSRDQNRLPVAIRVQFRFLEPETKRNIDEDGASQDREQEEEIPLQVDIATEDDEPELAYDAEFLLMVKMQPIDLGASLPLRKNVRSESSIEEDQ